MRTPDEIIISPVISEKSIARTSTNQYTFVVTKDATKKEIANAVSKKFSVDVIDAKVVNIRGKKVRFGKSRREGQRQDKRKAMVVIKAGQKIELFEMGNK